MEVGLQLLPRAVASPPSSTFSYHSPSSSFSSLVNFHQALLVRNATLSKSKLSLYSRRPFTSNVPLVGPEETELAVSSQVETDEERDPDALDLERVNQVKRALELLKKNRDMLFGEVKLTIMIEDPREVERRRLLGIEDSDSPTREDLAAALEEINEGKVPKNRTALEMLAKEMTEWPNLEVEVPKKKPSRSRYAKATDTGVDPQVAARRLNIDWDSAAEIEETASNDEAEVPPALGYSALYLVTAFPVIIGISVVLILFYNSLQ